MEIGPVVSSGEYPGMKNGGTSYNMSQPVILRCSYYSPNLSLDVLIDLVPIQNNACITYAFVSIFLSLVAILFVLTSTLKLDLL